LKPQRPPSTVPFENQPRSVFCAVASVNQQRERSRRIRHGPMNAVHQHQLA
jgi:hypothetical protein